jgi:hypothetical protein
VWRASAKAVAAGESRRDQIPAREAAKALNPHCKLPWHDPKRRVTPGLLSAQLLGCELDSRKHQPVRPSRRPQPRECADDERCRATPLASRGLEKWAAKRAPR